MQKMMCEYLFLSKFGLLSVGHVRLSHTCLHHKVWFDPNSISKRYPHLGFCIVGLKGSLKDHVS